MEIYTGIDQIKQLPIFTQLDHPVALTAPLIADDQVIIGLYCELTGPACTHIDSYRFIDLKHFLYDPQTYRVLVHGAKRIWENHEIGSLYTATNLVSDTEMIAYLLDSGREEHEYSLSYLAHKYLDINYPNRAQDISDKGFPDALYEILTDDAYLIWELASVLLDRMDDDLMEVYFFSELKIALILNEMSRYGIPVDRAAAAQTYRDTLIQMNKLADEVTGGEDLNLWNGSDVYQILKAAKVSLPNRAILRKQEVTHDDLKNMALSNPIAGKILEWRDLQIDLNFLKQAAGKDRIHPRWNMMTKTSRITASNPAVQNVNKVRCRPLMRPGANWVMIKADYKQIQMRILANLSNDPELVAAFREGRDVHSLTVDMCGIQGATENEKRDKAKAVNYGILFQMTADGLSRELNTDRKTAQEYINVFWAKYSVAKKYLDDYVENLAKEGHETVVRSYLGRIRRFSGEFGSRERRQAKATLLQQMEADLLRMAVMRLYATFSDLGMKSRIVMVIHDAVYVEAPVNEAEQAYHRIKTIMEDAVEMPAVPLAVDVESLPGKALRQLSDSRAS